MGAIFHEDWKLKGEWRTEEVNEELHSNWHLGFKVVVCVLGGGGGSRRSYIICSGWHIVSSQMCLFACEDDDPLV